MNFDELKECTRCGSDACYNQEVTKDINIEYCIGCGFQHNSAMISGSEFLKEQLEVLPELYKELMDEEEESGKIWVPTSVNINDKGMIFASGNGRDNWYWAAVKVVPCTIDEKKKLKSDYKADMSTLSRYDEGDFMDALSYIEVIP
jgi:hypothetical protein